MLPRYRKRPLLAGALWLLACAAASRPTPAPEASPGASPAVRAGWERAADELLCHCGCSRQTLRECTCGVAFGLRDQFESRLAAGESADAIIASYVGEHGEQSRNVPPKRGLNLLAWWGPALGILIAAAATIVTLLVWVSRGRARKDAPSAPAPAEADPLRRKLEAELREFEL